MQKLYLSTVVGKMAVLGQPWEFPLNVVRVPISSMQSFDHIETGTFKIHKSFRSKVSKRRSIKYFSCVN